MGLHGGAHRHPEEPVMAGPGSVPSRVPTGAPEPAPVMRVGDELAGRLIRTEVQRAPSSIPGREIVQVFTELPRGVESGWHTHPGEEVGYLVGGTVELCVAGRPARTVHAGEGFLIPPRTPHNARDLGPGSGRILSTYVVEAGEPLSTMTG
jgi:quercetin dioxygenase-like cupin family protein